MKNFEKKTLTKREESRAAPSANTTYTPFG